MKFIELDERLIAINANANKSAVWLPFSRKWQESTPFLAAKAWTDGKELKPAQISRRFLDVDLEAPALDFLR
jgi:hypothetical protein